MRLSQVPEADGSCPNLMSGSLIERLSAGMLKDRREGMKGVVFLVVLALPGGFLPPLMLRVNSLYRGVVPVGLLLSVVLPSHSSSRLPPRVRVAGGVPAPWLCRSLGRSGHTDVLSSRSRPRSVCLKSCCSAPQL